MGPRMTPPRGPGGPMGPMGPGGPGGPIYGPMRGPPPGGPMPLIRRDRKILIGLRFVHFSLIQKD